MKKPRTEMLNYINETIDALLESVEKDGRFDSEQRAEAAEMIGVLTYSTVGYDMTDEEHGKFIKLLQLRSQCIKIQDEVDDIFDSID